MDQTTLRPLLSPPSTPLEATARGLAVSCLNQLAIPGFLFNPLSLARARLQLQPRAAPVYAGLLDCLRQIVTRDGVLALWRYGVAMSMLREFSYGGMQWGLYTPLKALLSTRSSSSVGGSSGSSNDVVATIGAGLFSGALASCFVAPVDQLMLRMYVEGGCVDPTTGLYTTGLRAGQPPSAPSYAGMLRRIHADGGLEAVFRGTTMTVYRAALITVGLTSGYDLTKEICRERLQLREGALLHVLGSLSAGVWASVLCAPFDLIKSRLMVTPECYPHGALECLAKTLRAEGPRGLFIGVGANIVRLAPSTCIYMPMLEQMRVAAGLDYFGVTTTE